MTEKPTLEELEAILNAGESPPIEILPNGEVRVLEETDYDRGRRAGLEEAGCEVCARLGQGETDGK